MLIHLCVQSAKKYFPDTHLHAYWFCPIIQNYWGKKVLSIPSVILHITILASPSLCILHYFDDGVPCVSSMSKDKRHFLLISLTIAQKVILLNWKSRSNVSTIHWLSLWSDLASLEISIFKLNNKLKDFYTILEPFLSYTAPRQPQIWHFLPNYYISSNWQLIY